MAQRLDPYSLVGTTLRDRHTVVAFGGTGRFSLVYRAIDAVTERPVALRFLKVRRNLTPSQRTVIVERLGSLVSPMIEVAEQYPAFADVLEVNALVMSDGPWVPVLIQPWLVGETLESVLVRERSTPDARRSLGRAIDLLSPVADAIQYAHARGVVHGSLGPRSLLVCGARPARSTQRADWTQVDVLDLGMAGVMATLQERDRAFSQSPEPLCFFDTAHAAPEQFGGAGPVGPAADVFALALLVTELVTGEPALGGGDDEQRRHAALDPALRPTPQSRDVALGPYAVAVLERALAVNPNDRYATVGSFWDALRAASRVMLKKSASSLRPPPLPAGESRDLVLPKTPPLPDLVTMKSIVAGDESYSDSPYGRTPTRRDFMNHDRSPRAAIPPPPRANIPPHEFFAPPDDGPDAAVSIEEVAGVTNPLFGGIGRSVPPVAMDAVAPSERAAGARAHARIVRVAALAASFVVGASGASLAQHELMANASTTFTPLPADVLAAYAAIKPIAPAPPVIATCPVGMVRVPGGSVPAGTSAVGASGHDTTLAPFCIDAREVTGEALAIYLDGGARGKHAKSAKNTPASADTKTAAAYCVSREAHLPSGAEWGAGAATDGVVDVAGGASEWTFDGVAPHAGVPSDPKGVARSRGAPGAKSRALGFRCAE